MSRIGKNPVPVPEKVTVSLDGLTVKVKGPKGELERTPVSYTHLTLPTSHGV